jgi:hypothetical protein
LVPPAAKGTPVAQVGEVTVTAEQLEARLQLDQAARNGPQTLAALRDLRDDQVRFELLARAAVNRQLDRDPEVIDAARQVMVRKLLQQDLGPTAADQAAADAQARAYYTEHRSNWRLPEKRRFAQIELAHTAAGRSQAQGLIERMRRHHDLPQTFAAMAQKLSRDTTTRAHGGEEPFSTFDEVAKGFGSTFATAVFAHDIAEAPATLLLQPIETARGWHVVCVLSRREALVRSFDEVKDIIEARLAASGREARFAAYLNQLRKTCPVALYDTPLEQVAARWKAHAHGSAR